MQSNNYVQGVSGWKLYENGNLELDGLIRSGPAKGEVVKAEPKPFIVVDGVTYISQAEVERASIAKAKADAGKGQALFFADRFEIWSGGVCRMKYPA